MSRAAHAPEAKWAAIASMLMLACAGCGGQGPERASSQPAGAFPSPRPLRRATLWAVGDGDGSAASRAVAAVIARGRPTRLLYLGDVYEAGSAKDFRDRYATTFGRLRARTLPTPGNHEWPARAGGYDLFCARITAGRPPAYYANRIAGWQILSLNSEQWAGPGSAQGRWLANRLRGASTCRVAFWHRPRFSAGLHGDQSDVEPLWHAIAGRAALVVNGHDHDMQQLRPMSGTTEVVAGSGGHGHYPVNPLDKRVAWSNATDYGALRIRLQPRRATLAFVSATGQVLHRSSVTCAP